MIIFKTIDPYRKWLTAQKKQDTSIGFVPTMGALHQGHISLLQASKKENTATVCSIFVNPTQFNDPADYQMYPITTEDDIEQLAAIGTDVLFLPSVAEMYPNGPVKQQGFALGELENVFEGAFRPGHFQGVCQVVSRLLDIVTPHKIYMGQKDYQQCMVVARLLDLKQSATSLIIGPTLRESSGLAMSSRNRRLTEEEKGKATVIWKTMQKMKAGLANTPVPVLIQKAKEQLKEAGFHKTDYCQPAHATTLGEYIPGEPAVILCAAFLGKVRLIDNLLVNA